jgi:putative SOS response-associated peptidase YedK
VILSRERWRVWLSDVPLTEIEAMLEEDRTPIEAYPVGMRISSVKHDDASLLERVEVDHGLFGLLDQDGSLG